MTRANSERTWAMTALPGLKVTARRGSQTVSATLVIDRKAPTLVLRVVAYEHVADADAQLDEPPLKQIEAWANQPMTALRLLDDRDLQIVNEELTIDGARNRGKKPDSFYERVLQLKARLTIADDVSSYAEEIASANGVSAGVVYRWVNEAKRRGLTEPELQRIVAPRSKS